MFNIYSYKNVDNQVELHCAQKMCCYFIICINGVDLIEDYQIQKTSNISFAIDLFVWTDKNEDGHFEFLDGDEPYSGNSIQVSLYDAKTRQRALGFNGKPLPAVKTNELGRAIIENIKEGEYYLSFENKPYLNRWTVKSNNHKKYMVDSWPDHSGTTEIIHLKRPTQNSLFWKYHAKQQLVNVNMGTVSAGMILSDDYSRFAIGRKVFHDIDDDGLFTEKIDVPLVDVKVSLYDSDTGNIIGEELTNADGDYLFDNLRTGRYKIQLEVPHGYKSTLNGYAKLHKHLLTECFILRPQIDGDFIPSHNSSTSSLSTKTQTINQNFNFPLVLSHTNLRKSIVEEKNAILCSSQNQ
ncbi:hypothetical protein PPL_11100 [Heterostelium album PN500]|uniref:SD-repeat containing protein B domain-containing protein n=1 Tax=Heterostelium pallidum (strain ATCC 26659 / Pp 5 / PN500) TaxID=670386 RepID=D3BSY0_HETP5|nr:hypothetical protein PPL_11100 [Heterostelium album PN500]EFA75595.1 hypothetical protein PPL_11100 [Heterostelium album PN500]|eukprot:XP_020427729.1 hypothetical protein PPL_11100 [Heterostelium album PN500]